MIDVASTTAQLTHLAGLVGSFPLEDFRSVLAEQMREAAARHADGGHQLASDTHRRARRAALVAAVAALNDFTTAIGDAMQHNRSVARALELEASEAREAASLAAPAPVRHLRAVSAVHAAFPGARRTIPGQLEEALPDEPA